MTCAEFKRLFSLELTRAELSAWHAHGLSCRSCSDWCDVEGAAAAARLSPDELREAIEAGIHDAFSVRDDPEA